MATQPVRVPESVHGEVHAAARLLGCNAAELLARAWQAYRSSPEFATEFRYAQKALSVGDIDAVAHRLHERALKRAKRRADAVKALRREG
jgi:hypothetical protein